MKIDQNISLGSYPNSLPRLANALALETPSTEYLDVHFSPSWIDLTLLCHLGCLLRRHRKRIGGTRFHFHNDKQISFLWRSGFFQVAGIQYADTNYRSEPDIHKRQPPERPRLNFTQLQVEDIRDGEEEQLDDQGYSAAAGKQCAELLEQLLDTAVWESVSETDLFSSKEYLSVVLWELIQNAIDHSKGTSVIAAGQIFSLTELGENSEVRRQHWLEVNNTALDKRKQWLRSHSTEPFLLIACADDGIGIPDSMRKKYALADKTDDELTRLAFHRQFSKRSSAEYRYDIHGLHLIEELVTEYGGYLFLQTGEATLEVCDGKISTNVVSKDEVLIGTAYQVLLPLRPVKTSLTVDVSDRKRGDVQDGQFLFLTQELRRLTFQLPPKKKIWNECADAVSALARQVSGILYLDLSAMPRERHFLSLLLQCIRRRRFSAPTVIINASPELFDVITHLKAIDGSAFAEPDPTDFDPTSFYEEPPAQNEEPPKADPIEEVNDDLSIALTRGVGGAGLPLLLPITNSTGGKIRIEWLGMGRLSQSVQVTIRAVLAELFSSGRTGTDRLSHVSGCSDHEVDQILSALSRANPGLLEEARHWGLSFDASLIMEISEQSHLRQLKSRIDAVGHHQKPSPDWLYYLNWRKEDEAYISTFYSLWPVVHDPLYATFAAEQLLRKAYREELLDTDLSTVSAVISVTPSAGLIAREFSRILRISHWEASSVFDLKDSDWPVTFEGRDLLIIDDLIDTGTVTSKLYKHCKGRKGVVVGVLSLLQSVNGKQSRESLPVPVVSLFDVDLGRPDKAAISAACNRNTIFNVDPYTLIPNTVSQLSDAWNDQQNARKSEIQALASEGAITTRHTVYSGHHYNVFFNLVRLLQSPSLSADLIEWFWTRVKRWYSKATNDLELTGRQPVSVIYPYSSPIGAFLHEAARSRNRAFAGDITFHVARPYRRSQNRTGYDLAVEDIEATRLSSLMVFIDDGIATGGTLSSIVDEVVQDVSKKKGASLLALVVFDRIGMSPRRHLRNLDRYRGQLAFEYDCKFSFNLRSYFATNCPTCKVEDLLVRFQTRQKTPPAFVMRLMPKIRSVFDADVLTGVCTLDEHQAGAPLLLTSAEVSDVIHAKDALFSDVLSSEDIRARINDSKMSAASRLETLLGVVSDDYLWRKVNSPGFFVSVTLELFLNQPLTAEYRIWFILQFAANAPVELVRTFLLAKLPDELSRTQGVVDGCHLGGSGSSTYASIAPVAVYFDEHPSTFASIILALWIANERSDVPFMVDFIGIGNETPSGPDWNRNWFNALRRSAYEHVFSIATSRNDEDAARRHAISLLCNFRTHFRRHPESYYQRIKQIHQHSGGKFSAETCPVHLMGNIVESIRVVKEFYHIDDSFFPDSQLQHLLETHESWVRTGKNGRELSNLLDSSMVPRSTAFAGDTILAELLSQLSPSVDDVIAGTWRHLATETDFVDRILGKTELGFAPAPEELEERVSIEFGSGVERKNTFCFGNTEFLIRTVSHLLQNAFEHSASPQTSEVGLVVRLESRPDGQLEFGKKRVVFSVTSPQELTDAQVEQCFSRWGGLMIQRQTIKAWGGELGGRSGERAEFVLEVPYVDIERPV